MSSKRRKKKCRKFLDDFDESFFLSFFVRDLSFFLSFLKRVLCFEVFAKMFYPAFYRIS